jgi:hypothetical protein
LAMTANKVLAAFLYGQNIPGQRYLTGSHVDQRLRPFRPTLTFTGIVSRPDSVLVLCEPSITEQALGEILLTCLECKSVVIDGGVLDRIVKAAKDCLHAIGQPTRPPYRASIDDAEWEWCLVLCSEDLPPSVSDQACFGKFSRNVFPVQVVENRALLARQHGRNRSGTRVTLGSILNEPWKAALKQMGILPACLTSRTLNQAEKVALAAQKYMSLGSE